MISVCMATYNGQKYIHEQLASILPQLGDDDEVIISDDGSTDSTLDIIAAFDDRRIKIYQHEQAQDFSQKYLQGYYYASANFNNALIHATGDFFFISDQDDRWKPDKVKICMAALQKADIIFHNFDIIDDNSNIIERQHHDNNLYTHLKTIDYIRVLPFRGCCLAFSRAAYDRSVPIPVGTFEHDVWIGLNGLVHGLKYQYIPTSLLEYRRHNYNISELQSPNSLRFKLTYRLRLVWQIAKHWYK